MSSRTDPDGDVDDVASFSALDVGERTKKGEQSDVHDDGLRPEDMSFTGGEASVSQRL